MTRRDRQDRQDSGRRQNEGNRGRYSSRGSFGSQGGYGGYGQQGRAQQSRYADQFEDEYDEDEFDDEYDEDEGEQYNYGGMQGHLQALSYFLTGIKEYQFRIGATMYLHTYFPVQ